MDSTSLPENVRKFLLDHVRTYEELAILLKLHGATEHKLGLSELVRELSIEEEPLVAALEHLAHEGLVRLETDEASLEPRTTLLGQAVDDLAQAYVESRFAIVELMSSSSIERLRSAAIRTFAEAFRLRGPKKNG